VVAGAAEVAGAREVVGASSLVCRRVVCGAVVVGSCWSSGGVVAVELRGVVLREGAVVEAEVLVEAGASVVGVDGGVVDGAVGAGESCELRTRTLPPSGRGTVT
jgi:hypothetical protein